MAAKKKKNLVPAPEGCGPVFTFKVSLERAPYRIWRRIVVDGSKTLLDLASYILGAMGWDGGHLFSFTINGIDYGRNDDWSETEDADEVKICDVLNVEKMKCTFLYDFGDSWQHKVVVEKIQLPEEAELEEELPYCSTGKGACPPEDVGGVYGFAHFLSVMQNPESSEYEELKEWYGGDFDPDNFDPGESSARMNYGIADQFM